MYIMLTNWWTRRSAFALASFCLFGATVYSPAAQGLELFGGVGTTGVEIGLGSRLSPSTGMRMDAEFLDYSRSFDRNGASYDTKLKCQPNIDAEQRNLQESVDKLKFFPAVKFGIGYNF